MKNPLFLCGPANCGTNLVKAILEGSNINHLDMSCFNGKYVTGDVSLEYLDSLEKSRNDDTKNHTKNADEPIGLHNQA